MKNLSRLILGIIIVLAFVLRFYRITEVPPSLNWDEASIGYNAYSILKTGHDEWGEFLPLHFKSYGEYKLPGQVYASIPAIYLFGLNPFGVRITPVIYGTLTILFLYFLGRDLFKNKNIGLISSFLLAVSPWHILLTRVSFESSFALFWLVMGVWFFVKGFRKKKWWVVSTIPFALGIYTYNSTRVFIPIFLTALLFIFRKEIMKRKKTAAAAVILFFVFLLPLVPFYTGGEGGARYKLVSITDDPGLLPRINERRGMSDLPAPLPRLIHNKVTYISFYVAENYLAHFTPAFLFLSGASHKQHHIQNIGQLYVFQAPFLLLGLYILFKRKQTYKWLLLSWLLLALVPVSVTQDSIPHALRTLNAVPVYQLISALGLYWAYEWLKKKPKILSAAFWLVVVFFGVFQFVRSQGNLHQTYPILYSRDWQYGNKEAVEYIKDHYQDYDLIVYTREYGEPHMFTLFYLNYPPEKYQNSENLDRFETYDWVRVLRFDKFYFPDLGDEGTKYEDVIKANQGKKILFVGTAAEIPESTIPLKEINFLNGNPAFRIVEVI